MSNTGQQAAGRLSDRAPRCPVEFPAPVWARMSLELELDKLNAPLPAPQCPLSPGAGCRSRRTPIGNPLARPPAGIWFVKHQNGVSQRRAIAIRAIRACWWPLAIAKTGSLSVAIMQGFVAAAVLKITSRQGCQLKAHEQNGAENQCGKTEQKQIRSRTAVFIV